MSSKSLRAIKELTYRELESAEDKIIARKAATHGSTVRSVDVVSEATEQLRDAVPGELLLTEFVAGCHRRRHNKAKVSFDGTGCMFAANADLTIGPGEYGYVMVDVVIDPESRGDDDED
jgi:hypothetical protein